MAPKAVWPIQYGQFDRLVDIIWQAGKMALEYYEHGLGLNTTYKEDTSPVTDADKAIDSFLRQRLVEIEEIPVLSEEAIDDGKRLLSSRIWLVDPIDGTRDFVAHTDEFVINIALIEGGRPVLGCIYHPITGHLYFAYRGQGAYKIKIGGTLQKFDENRMLETCCALHVKDVERPQRLILLKSRFSNSERLNLFEQRHAPSIDQIKEVGSCLKGCMIAEGKAHGYYRFGTTCEWDTAPMDLIVHEAGGLVRQLDGSNFEYNRIDIVNRQGFYVINHEDDLLDYATK